jgi:hypothetical protein
MMEGSLRGNSGIGEGEAPVVTLLVTWFVWANAAPDGKSRSARVTKRVLGRFFIGE